MFPHEEIWRNGPVGRTCRVLTEQSELCYQPDATIQWNGQIRPLQLSLYPTLPAPLTEAELTLGILRNLMERNWDIEKDRRQARS